MFGIFKKKKEEPRPNPETAKMAERINEQTQIAELQSQISELRRQSAQMNSDVAHKLSERTRLMAEIPTVPAAKKVTLARQVQNIDKYVAGLNGSLALIEQQIGNIEAKIVQIRTTIVVDTGDSEPVVKASDIQKKLREATEKKKVGDVNAEIADGMFAELTGDAASNASDVADILAEAEGTGQVVPSESITTPTSNDMQPSHPMPTGQL